jgi:hypothetical protein
MSLILAVAVAGYFVVRALSGLDEDCRAEQQVHRSVVALTRTPGGEVVARDNPVLK